VTAAPDATPREVADDGGLLELMMADLAAADPLFRPTNYWQYYERRFLPELRRLGLAGFRRRHDSVLASFGAVDVVRPIASVEHPVRSRLLNNAIGRRLPGWLRFWRALKRRCPQPEVSITEYLTPQALRQLYFGYAEWLGGAAPHAKPLASIGMSRVGDPEDVFTVDGREYSLSFVYQYLRYAFASRFVDFDGIRTFVELGSGSGKQIELLRKLHPRACYVIVDIPPQLYVAHQYLDAVFPGAVVPYRETRRLGSLQGLEPGRIYVLGSGQFPLIETVGIDLFWNAASFQEMEPRVVANYLGSVNRAARAVFLSELMAGQAVAPPGGKGVLEQTTLDDYRRCLPDFELAGSAAALPYADSTDTFWRRRA
jgi:putative sugar O-methyltransferase